MSATRPIDRDRSAVYQAEDRLAALMRPKADRNHSGLDLPLERRFADRVAVQHYCRSVLALPSVSARFGPLPPIEVRARRGTTKAEYLVGRNTIAIPERSRELMRELVALHEIAHHVVAHRWPDEAAHGPRFRGVLVDLVAAAVGSPAASVLLDAFSGSGLTVDRPAGSTGRVDVDDRTIARVQRLLAKAHATTNTHEAEAYLAKAQVLATAASLGSEALHAGDNSADLTHRKYEIGEYRRAHTPHLQHLFVAIARANMVRCDVALDSTFVIAFGTEADIDVVEAMYMSLSVAMTTTAQEYVRSRAWEGTHYIQVTRDWQLVDIPQTARSARLNFYRGFVEHIDELLADAAKDSGRSGAGPNPTDTETTLNACSTGDRAALVAQRAERIDRYHREHSSARGTKRLPSRPLSGGSAASAGRSAARASLRGNQPGVGRRRAIGN